MSMNFTMSSMLKSPALFQEILNSQGLLDVIYSLMDSGDMGGLVMEALAVMKKTGSIPPLVKMLKDKAKSTAFRNEGNRFYNGGKHQEALELYNKALLTAPKGSEELALAFGNRSALFFNLKSFQACITDIELCLAMGCPKNVIDKLNKRMSDAKQFLWIEKMAREARYSQFVHEFFQLNETRNPQIPCVSSDVGVVYNSELPAVVAVNEIKVGKVLAVEESFVSVSDRRVGLVSCHHCDKMDLNLLPCESCCIVLYCSKDCQQTAYKEYHRIICPIVELLGDVSNLPISFLCLKAAIKTKNQFETWAELIEAASSLGIERMKLSNVDEIFDGNNKFSMLNMKDDRTFLHGHMYNAALGCAIVMNYLDHLKMFFPVNKQERATAMNAFATLLMYYTINGMHTLMSSTFSVVVKQKTTFSEINHFAMFPFVGKLKHACNPNVLALGLNKRIALVAIQPIKPGTELTISYIGHWLDGNIELDVRSKNFLSVYGICCDCTICNGDHESYERAAKPTEIQLKCFRKLNVEENVRNFSARSVPELYPKCCKALAYMSDLPFSKEYAAVYRLLRKCLLDIEDYHSGNVMLDTNF